MNTNTALTMVSSNEKTGPIPVSTSARETCPTTCPFYNSGCYAKGGPQAIHWRKVTKGERGQAWNAFIASIRRIQRGQLWRHNVSGDLRHTAGEINRTELQQLARANRGRKGFTYTHHVLNGHNVAALREANAAGFTVNASCESVNEADRVMTDHGLPAVAVVNSAETRRFFTTSTGRRVITCPATIHEGVTCSTCGLCQRADRDFIVAFPAHGNAKRKVDAIIANR
jgi:hypothetical protein